MVNVTNLTTGVITVGEEEFIILPSSTSSIPEVRYDALKSEFLALSEAGQIFINTSTYPEYITTCTIATHSEDVSIQFTAAELLGGIILRTPTGTDTFDSFPNPADLVAAIPSCQPGYYIDFTIFNQGASTDGWCIMYSFWQPAGVTLAPDFLMLGQSQAYVFRAMVTNIGSGTEAYTVYRLSVSNMYRSFELAVRLGATLIGGNNGGGQETWMLTKTGYNGGFGAGGPVFFADNGGGGTRCSSYNHGLPDSSTIIIHGCGITSYNGVWVIAVIDGSHFDIATPFVGDVTPQTSGNYFWLPTYVDAGDISYAAKFLSTGFILRDPNGADRSDTLPDVGPYPGFMYYMPGGGAGVGSFFDFTIQNIADAAEKITLVAGAGMTLAPVPGATLEIPQGATRKFRLVYTNVDSGTEAATLYGLY